MDLSSDEVRLWVIQRFRRIAEEVGMRQADLMADYLEAKKRVEAWKEMDARVVSWAPGPLVQALRSVPESLYEDEGDGEADRESRIVFCDA